MKSKLFSLIYGLVLIAFTAFVLLDAFVIERVYVVVDDSSSAGDESEKSNTVDVSDSSPDESDESGGIDDSSVAISENSYDDGKIRINITEHRIHNTTVYVADVVISSPDYLKTAFAEDKYGKNIKEKTSVTAKNKGALLAVNGDYYSARNGCVLRNGTLYRDFSGDSEEESLIINSDGSFSFVNGRDGDGNALDAAGALQVITFGPALLDNGAISVATNDEVDKAMRNNPRTALAWYGGLHYAFIVADGRTTESTGLSLYQLAEFTKELGAKCAYNLDGGGSSTMYFNGKVINNPTTNGKKISEREVSDIVYIGY